MRARLQAVTPSTIPASEENYPTSIYPDCSVLVKVDGLRRVRPHSVAREGIPGNPAAMLRRRRRRRRRAIHQPAVSGPASASWQHPAPGPPVA